LTKSSRFPAGSYWSSIFDAVLNDENQVFITGIIRGASVASTEQVIARFDLNDSLQATKETVLWKDNDRLPDGAGPTASANPSRDSWAWEANNRGDLLMPYTLFPSGGGSTAALYLNDSQLLKVGTPSTIAGQNWGTVTAAHLNNTGDWVALVGLSGGDSFAELIVKNGVKVTELGAQLPNGNSLDFLGKNLFVSDSGDVFWMGGWITDSDSIGMALFKNEELLVQTGVTQIDGSVLGQLGDGTTGASYAVSDDGSKIIFGGYLTDGRSGLFMFNAPEPGLATILIPLLVYGCGTRGRQ
jgi:hypothetical protein